MVTSGFRDDCIEIQAGTMDVPEFGLCVFGQRRSDVLQHRYVELCNEGCEVSGSVATSSERFVVFLPHSVRRDCFFICMTTETNF